MLHPFDKSVRIALRRTMRDVASADEAAEALRDIDWPKRGPRHRDASETCMKVLEGTRSASDARAAFVRAAREAGMLVEETP